MNKFVNKYLEQYKSLNNQNLLLHNHYDFSDVNKRKKLINNQNYLVSGVGSKKSKIYIFLESFNNNRLGEQADILFGKILDSINLDKKDIFKLDFLQKQSVSSFNNYIDKFDLDIISLGDKPKLIIAMGSLVSNILLNNKKNIESLRNKVHNYNGIDLIVTYHPKDLILKTEFKRPTWEDFKFIRDKYSNG